MAAHVFQHTVHAPLPAPAPCPAAPSVSERIPRMCAWVESRFNLQVRRRGWGLHS